MIFLIEEQEEETVEGIDFELRNPIEHTHLSAC